MIKNITAFVLLTLSFKIYAEPDEHRFGLAASLWGVLDNANKGAVHVNYEFAELEQFWCIRPTLLVMTDFDSKHYFSIGWLKEWDWTTFEKVNWGISGQGGYFHNAGRLGYDIEFYTRLFVNYELSNESLIRAELGHISNAGFGDNNPGSENIAITYLWRF